MGILSKVSKGAKALAEAFESEKAGKALSAADLKKIEATTAKAPAVLKKAEKQTRGNYNALPLKLPRSKPKDFGQIDAMATRMARQMEGEHVTSGKPKDTTNLANRSKKESERLEDLKYNLMATKDIPPIEVYEPKIGDMITGLPGDQTVSDKMLVDVNGIPIGSQQEGGSLYGFGHLTDSPEGDKFWASNFAPLNMYNNKLADLADMYGPEAMYAQHIAMGRVSNNFAQHFADANLKYINNSNTPKRGIQGINKLMQDAFPDFPGVENQAAAYEFFKENSEARKYFNNRMKVPAITEPLGLPNGLDIEFAITEPLLRNKEINLTGMSVGKMNPYADLVTTSDHNTYTHGITGTAQGKSKNLMPFTLQFPDAAEHIASTQPPESFTGTLQKVFPHQQVDQQLMDEIGLYNDLIKFYTGKKKGGLVHMADGGTPPVRKPISELIPLDDANLSPTVKSPIAKTIGKVAKGVHEFVSKPFGYENPPGKFISELFGIPAIGRTAENIAYGTPITTGSGQTLSLSPDTAEAALTVLPSAPLAGKLAVKAAPAVGKVAKASAPYVGKLAQEFAEKTQMGFPLQMNVMKPKGGNWLAGATDPLINPLKSKTAAGTSSDEALKLMESVYTPEKLAAMLDENRAFVNDRFEEVRRGATLNKWLDQKLGRYVKNEMATPQDQIRLGIERRAVEAEALKELNNKRLAKMQADIDRAKAAGKDTTLSENDLEAAREKFNDEYAIASRGLYHGTPPYEGWAGNIPWEDSALPMRRKLEGMPEDIIATHPAAKHWEIATDAEVYPSKAGEFTGEGYEDILEKNPFLSKVDPSSKVYELGSYPDVNLEFRHMIDEVKTAMDPDSNLPKSLRISPKDLEKMTVDDVSALSGKISAWRDIQKTKADLQLANNPAVHTFKEYPPENNPKGVSWRQIKRPEGLPDKEAEKYVREATKYEGDIMRHCVGGAGHCEPLLNGEVEIYSLRDAKGEPHVTIEVSKPDIESGIRRLPLEEREALKKKVKDNYFGGAMPGRSSEEQYYEILEQEYVNTYGMPKPIIEEIKGKNNRKPNDEYIPFVQDFIRSGQWSDVGDIGNTGMRATRDVFSDSELRKLKELGYKPNPVLSGEEIQKLHNAIVPEGQRLKYSPEGNIIGGEGNYAKGGAVSNNDLESRMNAMLAKGYAKGGAVNSGSLEDKMNKMLAATYAPKKMADGGFTKVGSFKIGGRISLIKH